MILLHYAVNAAVLAYGGIRDHRNRMIPDSVPLILLLTGLVFGKTLLLSTGMLILTAAVFLLLDKLTDGGSPGGDFKLLCALAFSSSVPVFLGTLLVSSLGALLVCKLKKTGFFYCDPPYHNTEGYYKNLGEKGFVEMDHLRLQDTLLKIKGKFMLSYNDDRFIRELYNEQGIYIVSTDRAHTMRNRTDPNSRFPELIITNYDPYERAQQLSLFSTEEEEER